MKNWIRSCVMGAAMLGSLAVTQTVQAAVTMVLKAGDIRGESAVSRHESEIDVVGWSWGVVQPGARVGSGATGKASVNALVLTKYVDQASPLLFQAAVQGRVLPVVEFYVLKAGGKPTDMIKIHMENVAVASLATGKLGPNDRFTEEISLVFSTVDYSYTPTKPDGSPGAAVTMHWSNK